MRFSHGSDAPPHGLDALMKRFDLPSRLDEQSDKLPYGLQKMLGLVLAYVAKPKVLLLDEPAAGLEVRERTQVDDLCITCARNWDRAFSSSSMTWI